jgi:hypothetical protein
MKLAWICYNEYGDVTIRFYEPERWQYNRIVPIVYAEIKE